MSRMCRNLGMEFSVEVLKTKNSYGDDLVSTEAATDFLEGSLRSDGSLAFVQFDSG